MTRLNRSKLNHFMAYTPAGLVITSDWLRKHDISSKLAWWYVHSGWLERLDNKTYKKTGADVSWISAISALQRQLYLPVHIGGKTALQLLGKSHYIPMQGVKQVILFANPLVNVPSWFQHNKVWEVNFKIYKTLLFQDDDFTLGMVERTIEGVDVLLSSPERAAMEVLYLVPHQQLFDEAVLLIENLGQLRPSVVQFLLQKCTSIKVKRLFLHIAEKFQYQWLSELDLKKIDLGHGKRVVGGGGEYDPKYKLSVPKIIEEE